MQRKKDLKETYETENHERTKASDQQPKMPEPELGFILNTMANCH